MEWSDEKDYSPGVSVRKRNPIYVISSEQDSGEKKRYATTQNYFYTLHT
jgi:hypothetical protein